MIKSSLTPAYLATLFVIIAATAACRFWDAGSSLPAPLPAQQFRLGLTSAHSGLNRLDSYRANLIIDFEGSYGAQPVAGHVESLTEVSKPLNTWHRYLYLAGNLADAEITGGVSEFFRIDDQLYLKQAGDDNWLQFRDNDNTIEDVEFLELEKLITLPATVSTPPIRENIEGLSVQRYRFSEVDLSDPDIIFEKAEGEAWLATPGDYLVQYVISATLRIPIPDPTAHVIDKGSLRLTYTLTDIDADFAISPPAEALPHHDTLANLPRIPDAETITVLPTLIEYTSAISAISATLFYRNELSALDWSMDEVTAFNDKARLTFSKEGQALDIIITPAGEPDKIKVVLDAGKP